MRAALGRQIMIGLASCAMSIDCSETSQGKSSYREKAGEVGLQLKAATAVVGQVQYAIGDGVDTYTGTLVLPEDAPLLAVIGGIHPGLGYVVALSATSASGQPCSGTSSPFIVVANTTVVVAVNLLCRTIVEAGFVSADGSAGCGCTEPSPTFQVTPLYQNLGRLTPERTERGP